MGIPKMKFSLRSILLLVSVCLAVPLGAEIDPKSGRFYFRDNNPFPGDTLGRIALYLIQQNRLEGNAYVSETVEEGIVAYQIRFFDNGNKKLVDEEDLISIRRYTIEEKPDPAAVTAATAAAAAAAPLPPDGETAPPPPPPPKVETRYIEYVDHGLNGLDELDFYFLNGRRFDLSNITAKTIQEYQSQVATAVNVYIEAVNYAKIVEGLGSSGQTAIRKGGAYDDGSLPSLLEFGLDLQYVFKPIVEREKQLSEQEMLEEIRKRIGFVYSATVGYTDLSGFRFCDLADQTTLLQRQYDVSERAVLMLIVDALFDVDGDGPSLRKRCKRIHPVSGATSAAYG
jgi:hypothetical protein